MAPLSPHEICGCLSLCWQLWNQGGTVGTELPPLRMQEREFSRSRNVLQGGEV
jgi:hypothetical protein